MKIVKMNKLSEYLFFILIFLCCFGCLDKIEKKKQLSHINKLSKNNKRVGEWQYYNKKGDTIARGRYINGMKNGLWKYLDKTYNKSNQIEWAIYSNDLFKLNLPQDWEVKISPKKGVPISFFYENTINPNGNLVLIKKDSLLSLTDASKILIQQNMIGESHKLLLKKEVQINELLSIYSQQLLSINGEEMFIEQYFIEGSIQNYLISFFVQKSEISIYHQLFTEIAYSFTEKKNSN